MSENKFRVIRWCRWKAVAALVVLIGFQASLSTASSDCTEPEIPFPVQFTRADTLGSKAYLIKTIRKNVLNGSKRIQDGSQDLSVSMLSGLLDKEYRCNTGVALSTKEAEELLAILHQMYQETLTQGEAKPRTAKRLVSLQEEIGRRGSHSSGCSDAASELAQLVTSTTKEALAEKKEYETKLRQREARIEQCRKVALAGEEKGKAEEAARRKQEALEREKAEEQKLKAEIDRKRQTEELERQKKEAQKEERLRREAEERELHKKALALQKAREEQLKAEAEATKRKAEELERQQRELRSKIEQDRQLEAEKARHQELEGQLQADKERKVKQERQDEVDAAQKRQKEIQDQIALERKREAKAKSGIEQARGDQEEARRIEDLKSGKTACGSFSDAKKKYEPADGDEYVEQPPTAVPNDQRYLLLGGTVESREGETVICNVADSVFDEDKFKIRKWAFKPKGIGSYVPRIDEDVKVIGKIGGVIQGRTVLGKQIFMIVLDAVALETGDGKFHQR